MNTPAPLVFAIYPNKRGFGYVCVENHKDIVVSGVANIRPICNDGILKKIRRYLEYYQPTLLVVQDMKSAYARQSERTKTLIGKIVAMAQEAKLSVHLYSREQIREVFEIFQATSKYQIAKVLGAMFNKEHLIPREPKIYDNEGYFMGMFDALSLVVTHQYLAD